MSSTNRGYNRHRNDYYITPINEIVKFLNKSSEYIQYNNILDPCAGGDNSHPMSYPEAFKKIGINNIKTIDIRQDSKADTIDNFLELNDLGYRPDIIISNPPFDLAMEFIEHSLELANDNGFVIFLLRLNFLGSKKRNKFLSNNMPSMIFVHSRRMSFTDSSSTDSIEYAHFVWQKGINPKQSKLFLLDY